MTRDKSDLMGEFSFYIKNRVPHESIAAWLESLPDDERQIILDEITVIIGRAMPILDHIAQTIRRAVTAFMGVLSPEIKVILESFSDANLANK